MLGINASDTLFIGSVDAAVSSITFNVNGTTYGGFDASGNVNFTGNVILGNATTDTVTVNGYMSVGGTPTASQGLRVIPSGLTGTSQFGSVLSLTATSAATAGVEAARVQAGTAAAAFTTAYAAGLWVRDALRGAGSTITNNYGIYIDEKVAGTNNYGLVSVVAAGANKWNLYIDGTAANYFAGNVGIGTVTPGSPLTIGTATAIPLLINGQTTGASYISITNTGGAYVGGVNNSAGSAIVSGLAYSSLVGTNNATALQLTTNGNARLTVDSAGNVGIGTNAPGTLLQVQQTLANTYTSTSAIDAVPIGSLTSIVNLAQAADVFRGVNFSSRSAAGDLQNAYFGAVSTATGNSPIFVWGQRTGATAYAERMRITSAGEVLIGATAAINSSKLLVAGVTGSNPAVIQGGAAASAVLAFYNNAATNNRFMIGQGYGTASDNIAFIQNYVSAALVFGTNSTERMRVDASGNVGIGTNAPTTLVQASKTQNADTSISVVNLDTGAAASSSVQAGSDSGNAILAAYGSGFTPTGVRLASSAALLTSAASTGGLSIGARNAAGVIRFSTGGDTERMRIDSAGNLGLGITPSAWRTAAGTKALQIGVGGALFSQDSSGTYWTVLTSNSFQNTSNVDAYINTGFATSYTQTSGKHVWATAPSGTAGATITFTSAMTLDASGNLGIGTTTPTNLLSLGGNAARTIWMERHTTANTAGNNLTLQSGGATSGATDKTGGTLLLSSGTATGTGTSIITFLTATAGSTGTVDNAPAERMRINSTGNLLIGGTTPQGNSRIELLGTNDATSAISLYRSDLSHRTVIGANYIGTFTASSFSVFSNSLERITALSSGNVGIGTTTPVNKLQVNGSFGRNAPVTKTGNFTLGDAENWLICNGTATITVTLPAASSWTGREVMLKTIAAFTVVSASSNVVPLIGGAAGTAILAATAGKWVTLVSDGTNWITMAGA
ncbi:MAG: hypothetical protein EHM17_14845 [Verrucomicrobiaceae bacterium]|nr:MAG: hypothetical protein EHM17_14845 [Verrucomicrobiaceae bacterium]